MGTPLTKDDIQIARRSDLFEFLMQNHAEDFLLEYGSLRMIDNHSICIKQGYSGYKDFATDETGNSIDFLIRHMGYEFTEAVRALVEMDYDTPPSPTPQKKVCLICPPAKEGPYRQLYAYLTSRGIHRDTIDTLLHRKLLYQDQKNNLVFVNPERTWGECRGTNTFAERRCSLYKTCASFHRGDYDQCQRRNLCKSYKTLKYRGILQGSATDGYWYFTPDSDEIDTFYVCESSIDAISLYEIHRLKHLPVNGTAYVSIGGVGKQKAIDELIYEGEVILAVDNDAAGDASRKKNHLLDYIIPVNKDWNEDLLKGDLNYATKYNL